jgi:tryptophan 2,3-dioxygenase
MARKSNQAKPSAQAPSVYGASLMDYQDYLKIPELLGLQRPQSVPAHHDEMLFIVIHQAYELWFKLLVHEVEMSIQNMGAKAVEAAHHSISRVVEVLKLLVRQIHLLETMRPIDFLAFRDLLKPASGFQSVQFRELEFLVGFKDAGYLRFFENRRDLQKRLDVRLREPDLAEAYCALVRRLGYKVPAKTDNATLRTDPQAHEAVARALLPIYRDPATSMPLYLLTERLLELDETFSLWRQHHVHVVERIIGAKPGTGGSSGVSYLRTTTVKRAFPFLWEIRTLLESEPVAPVRR